MATGGPLSPPSSKDVVFVKKGIMSGEQGQTTSTDLGSQIIEGVVANGTRTTLTIPAGQIGNDQPIASGCGEIVVRSGFYSYDSKYIDEQAAEVRRFVNGDYDVVLGMLERRMDGRSAGTSSVRQTIAQVLRGHAVKPAPMMAAKLRSFSCAATPCRSTEMIRTESRFARHS